jgi:hypothetical protein
VHTVYKCTLFAAGSFIELFFKSGIIFTQSNLFGVWMPNFLVQRIVIANIFIMVSQLSASAVGVYVYGGDFDLRIPEELDSTKGWMLDAVIEVPEHFIINDLDVSIAVHHSNVFDLEILLESPDGTTLYLNGYDLSIDYLKGEDYIGTIFDDEAELPIERGSPPFTGCYRPKAPGSLSIFDGQDAYGKWSLKIYDAYYADSGNLSYFELSFTIPEPATVLLLGLGAAIMWLYTRWRFA